MKKWILFTMALMTIACNRQPLSVGIQSDNLDTTAVPQNDFYAYACGGWMKNHPIPDDYSRFGSFDKLGLDNLQRVNDLITGIASDSTHTYGSVAQKIATLYSQAMALDSRTDTASANILFREFDALEELRKNGGDREVRSHILGEAMEYGLWALYVDADPGNSNMNLLQEYQAGFTLGEKEYYLDNDEHSKYIRKEYFDHIVRMHELCGYIDGDLAAEHIIRLETRLARAALNNVELRDPVANYNKMSVADLQALVPQIDWDIYFAAMHIAPDSLSVGQIRHLQEAGKMLEEENWDDLCVLFGWQIMEGAAPYLSEAFFNEHFRFYGQVMGGQKEPSPLWKRATGVVNGVLGEAVGQMYVQKYFPEKNKQRMLALVKNLQQALGERITAQEWMSDTTRLKALEKLAAFNIKIGYPDTWRDYTNLDINPARSYYDNIMAAAKFEQDYSLSFVGKPVDKSKWYMTPQTVNAYYNPSSNEICFPAAILQYPFFDMSADDAFNYGAIGVVIGHEMTHGFDDQGCQFDKNGNLNNWWTDADKQAFVERTKVMENYFNGIEVAQGVFANGAFTLGENIADHGGLQIAWQAFCNNEAQKPDRNKLTPQEGFTPAQRFFLAYANVWAGNIRDEEVLKRTKSDPHSLGRWRVNGALPHIDAWYEAWNVDENSPMYVKPENRVNIW